MTSTILARTTAFLPAKSVNPSRLKQLALATATVAIVAGAGWYATEWWQTGRFIETTDDAYAGGEVTPVSPHVAGFIAEVLVADNQHVTVGELLIRLDQRDFRAALNHAQAVADERQAMLASLEAKSVLQQQVVAEAEAALAAKTANATFAAVDAARYRDLAATGYGSRQDAQRTSATEQEAQSAIRAAHAMLAAARQQMLVLQAEIAGAHAGIAQAQADLETARLNLDYTEIRSPIDGYVGNRAGRVGSYVAGGAYLLSMIPARGLWVDANFKEDQLANIRPGQPATVIADVLPGKALRGHVQSLAPGAGSVFSVIPPENATGNFTKIVQRVPVRVVLDETDARLGELRPGLSTTVSVDTRAGGQE